MNRPPKPVPTPPPRVAPPTTESVRISDPESQWRKFVSDRLLLIFAANLVNFVAIIVLGMRQL